MNASKQLTTAIRKVVHICSTFLFVLEALLCSYLEHFCIYIWSTFVFIFGLGHFCVHIWNDDVTLCNF